MIDLSRFVPGDHSPLIVRTTFTAITNLLHHDGSIRSGYIAFCMMLGIFPFLVFLAHATGIFSWP